jgi:hypothetical protein
MKPSSKAPAGGKDPARPSSPDRAHARRPETSPIHPSLAASRDPVGRRPLRWSDPADLAAWLAAVRTRTDDLVAAARESATRPRNRVLSRAEICRRATDASMWLRTLVDAAGAGLPEEAARDSTRGKGPWPSLLQVRHGADILVAVALDGTRRRRERIFTRAALHDRTGAGSSEIHKALDAIANVEQHA